MAAILNTQWYVNYGNGSSTGYYALAVWATAHTYAVGDIVRPLTAPAVGNERAYICTTAGLSVTEPTWTFTKGALQTGTVEKFNECTGQAALNGDITTCPIWVASSTYLLGMVVMNVARNGFFIATSVSGTGTSGGSEPAGLTTPVLGATTTDNSGANQVVWTCIKATGTAFAAWGAPHARLRKAYTATWGAAGDWFYIGDDHAETEAAAMSLTSPGTFALPCRVICVSHTGSTPPVSADLATTATISTTGTNGLSITSGSAYHYGIIFNCGTGSSSVSLSFCQDAVPCVHRFVSCSFVLVNTAAGSRIICGTSSGAGAGSAILENCTMSFSNSGQGIQMSTNAGFWWYNTPSAIIGASAATVSPLFVANGRCAGPVVLEGIDFSGMGTSKIIVAAQTVGENWYFNNCKYPTTPTKFATPTTIGFRGYVNVSDNAAHNYNQEIYDYTGTLSTETTIIRNSGASDGAQGISWKIITTANAKVQFPFECFTIPIWNPTVGSAVTATIHFASATASLKNIDIWADIEYMNSTTFPTGTQATSTDVVSGTVFQDPLSAGTALTDNDAANWAGSPAHAYTVAITFTPQMAGPIRMRVRVGLASLTVYVDPLITLS